jgi:hypothetical protein
VYLPNQPTPLLLNPTAQVKSTEDLLSLTRKIRKLWVIGPLKAPGAHDAQAEQEMQQDAEHVFAMLNAIRDAQRQKMLQQGGLTYERGEIEATGSSASGNAGQGPSESQTPAAVGVSGQPL